MVESFSKIKVDGVVVDLDGDEMTRVIWTMIKDNVRKILICISNKSLFTLFSM